MVPASLEWLLSQPFLRDEDIDRLHEKTKYQIRHSPNWEWSICGLTFQPNEQPEASNAS